MHINPTPVIPMLVNHRTETEAKTKIEARDMTVPLTPGAAFFMAQHKPDQVGFDVQTLLLLQG